MKIKLVISKYRPEEDEFVGLGFGQYRNKDGFWVFYLVFMNLGILITPLFVTKHA